VSRTRRRFPNSPAALAAAALITLWAAPARADDESLRRQVEDLSRRMQEMEARHQREMEELRRSVAPAAPERPSALQEQIDRLTDEMDSLRTKLPAQSAARGPFRLVDLSLNALMAGGWSTDDDDTIQALQAGGHDPHKRGFTLQNVELILSGAVDPHFTAQANLIALIDAEGETQVELEEAWAQTSSMPWGLQAKAGQFYAPFGRHNLSHPHQWDFVDIPVVSGRFLGPDGMRGPGAQLSWLGTDVPLELTAALQNANGETMTSFLGTDEEEPPAGSHAGRVVRSPDDLVATGRAAVSFDATDEIPILFGASLAHGPSGASSDDGSTTLTGLDFTAKWRPLDAHAGFPFVSFRTEWIGREYDFDDAGGRSTLDDSGWYAQTTWGFVRDWTLGARYDSFSGEHDDVPGLDDRTRWSLALTHFTSEFAKIRLQVNHDDARSLDDRVTSVWLQIEFNLGQHGAHRF
jgi:hypothetical protein